MKKTVYDVNVSGKRILLRADFNVPLKDGKVAVMILAFERRCRPPNI